MRKNQYISLAISVVVLIVSFLTLLELFFIEDITVETYVCRLSTHNKCYHTVICGLADSSYRTTVYQAEEKGYSDKCSCNPISNKYETTLYLHKPHYVPPAIISVIIAVVAYFVIKQKTDK